MRLQDAEPPADTSIPLRELKAFYSIAELAERWGVSRRTIYRLAADGTIKRSRVRRSVRFSAATVRAYEKKM